MKPDDGVDPLAATVGALHGAAHALDGFGGVWIDQAPDRAIHVGVAGTWSDDVVRHLRSLVPAGQELVLTDVALSMSDLEALHERLTEAVLSDDSFRAHLVELGLVPQHNAVRLTLLAGTPQGVLDRVAAELAAPGLVVDSAAEGYRTD